MANGGKYRLVESTGKDKGHRIEAVHNYDDLEKHHPSSGKEDGRNYKTINGRLEEIRNTADGRTLIKKDMIFQTSAGASIDVPSPAAGYVRTSIAYGTVAIYDKPQGGKLLGQVLHLNPNFRVKDGDYVAYGQPIGIQGGTGPDGKRTYGIHAHVELEESAFRQYIQDIDSGVIKPGVWPEHSAPAPQTQTQQTPLSQPESQSGATTDTAPAEEKPAQPALPGSATSRLIARGTSGDAGYDTINFKRDSTDVAALTINEYLRRSELPLTDADRLIAVGKYQITPGTMRDTMQAMQLTGEEKLTPELQEQMFAQYLIQDKRPDLYGYLTGAHDDVNLAVKDAALEWAAVANPDNGLSNYPPKGKAPVSAEEMAAALNEDRAQIQQLMQQGQTAEQAFQAVIGGQGAQKEQTQQQEQPAQTTPGSQEQTQGQPAPGEQAPPSGQAQGGQPGTTPGDQPLSQEEQIKQLEQKIAQLEQKIAQLEAQISTLQQEKDQLQQQNPQHEQTHQTQIGVGINMQNGDGSLHVGIHAESHTHGGQPATGGNQPATSKPQAEITDRQPAQASKPEQTSSQPPAAPAQNTAKQPETVEERQRAAVDYFQANGFSRAQSIGIVANLTRESGMKTGAVGDGGKAFGLAQWHPDRQAEFKKAFGHDIKQASFTEQLQFVRHELLFGQEKRAGRELLSQHTAADAAAAISKYYERPANTQQEMATRGKMAQELEQTLGQTHSQSQQQTPQLQQPAQRNPTMSH